MQCRFIFRSEGLDLGHLATAFALLRLPRMPELRGLGDLPNFTPSPVDPNIIKVTPPPSSFSPSRSQTCSHLSQVSATLLCGCTCF